MDQTTDTQSKACHVEHDTIAKTLKKITELLEAHGGMLEDHKRKLEEIEGNHLSHVMAELQLIRSNQQQANMLLATMEQRYSTLRCNAPPAPLPNAGSDNGAADNDRREP